jgi:hypothetical protein
MQLLLSDKHSATNEATKQSQFQFIFANSSFVLQTYNEGSRKMDDMSDDVICGLFMLIFWRLERLCSSSYVTRNSMFDVL